MDLELVDRESLSGLSWPGESLRFQDWLTELVCAPSTELVRNCRTESHLLRLGEHLMPLTVNNTELENSYVCSPYNGAVTYALDELWEIDSRLLRATLAGLIRSIAPVLRRGEINRVVMVNNWMLSTNLFSAWRGESEELLRRALVNRFPSHAILLRSLNRATNPKLMDALADAGWLMVPSRQVYLFEEPELYLKRPNTRRDLRLLEGKTSYEIVAGAELVDSDVPRLKRLYDQLYLDKYSRHNPQFTERLVEIWRRSPAIELFGLRNPSGTLDGVVGLFDRGGIVTAPFVGYDTGLPQGRGLYRMLMAIVFREASRRGQVLNLSSGAAQFKRLRGGKPQLEYTAVFCEHLPARRRRLWKALSVLFNQVGGRLLQRLEL